MSQHNAPVDLCVGDPSYSNPGFSAPSYSEKRLPHAVRMPRRRVRQLARVPGFTEVARTSPKWRERR